MKATRIIRKCLLLATSLSIFSFSPAEAASYAIDLACSGPQQLFIEAQLLRATTIAKFVALNLSSNLSNRQGWYLDGYIMNFVTLLMGDAQEALYNAQWVFGGTLGMTGTGIASFAASPIDKGVASLYDVVFYCDVDRLSPDTQGYVYDPDSADITRNTGILPSDSGADCTEVWVPGAPAYVFWQLPADAARISFCPWFLNMAMDASDPSLGVFADTRRIDELRDRVAAWPLNWGPWGYGTTTPNIQQFQLFDAVMISALSNTGQAGHRQPSTDTGTVTWARVVRSATQAATRYTSGAFVYLALVIFAYRSGITVNSDGSFGPNRATTPGQDYGDPNQNWALAWTPPNTGTG